MLLVVVLAAHTQVSGNYYILRLPTFILYKASVLWYISRGLYREFHKFLGNITSLTFLGTVYTGIIYNDRPLYPNNGCHAMR